MNALGATSGAPSPAGADGVSIPWPLLAILVTLALAALAAGAAGISNSSKLQTNMAVLTKTFDAHADQVEAKLERVVTSVDDRLGQMVKDFDRRLDKLIGSIEELTREISTVLVKNARIEEGLSNVRRECEHLRALSGEQERRIARLEAGRGGVER